MLKTSQAFKRGLLTGALLMAGLNSVLLLLMPPIPAIPVVAPGLKMLAALNLLLCASAGIFLYHRERRAGAV